MTPRERARRLIADAVSPYSLSSYDAADAVLDLFDINLWWDTDDGRVMLREKRDAA